VVYIKLYEYPWLPVLPGKFHRCRRRQCNLLCVDLLLPQRLVCSSCDLTDEFIIIVMSACCDIACNIHCEVSCSAVRLYWIGIANYQL